MELANLDQVEAYIHKNFPDWSMSRGWVTVQSNFSPAKGYEVIQVFRPSDENYKQPFAEFWRGYYDFNPASHSAFTGNNGSGDFSVKGEMEYVMKEIKREDNRLKACPAILELVREVVKNNSRLREIASEITIDDLEPVDYSLEKWSVETDRFKLGMNARCIIRVYCQDDCTQVKIWLEQMSSDDSWHTTYEKEYIF